MKVDLITSAIEEFKRAAQRDLKWLGGYKQDVLLQYNSHWDLTQLDLASMFEKSLYSETTGRLWGGSRYSARESMLAFLRLDSHFVRAMFRDLFQEEKDLSLRVQRFTEHAALMAKEMHLREKQWIDHHHDLQMVSLYLALRFPAKYTLFDYPIFEKSLLQMGSRSVPAAFEFGKFTVLSQAIYKMMLKDEELQSLYQQEHPEGWSPNTMMVHDLYEYIAENLD